MFFDLLMVKGINSLIRKLYIESASSESSSKRHPSYHFRNILISISIISTYNTESAERSILCSVVIWCVTTKSQVDFLLFFYSDCICCFIYVFRREFPGFPYSELLLSSWDLCLIAYCSQLFFNCVDTPSHTRAAARSLYACVLICDNRI